MKNKISTSVGKLKLHSTVFCFYVKKIAHLISHTHAHHIVYTISMINCCVL